MAWITGGVSDGCFLSILTLVSRPAIGTPITLNTVITFGLLFGLGGGALVGLRGGLDGLLMTSLIPALLVGLVYGGKIYLQHHLVRVMLELSKFAPFSMSDSSTTQPLGPRCIRSIVATSPSIGCCLTILPSNIQDRKRPSKMLGTAVQRDGSAG